ncbi:MAG: hypothetical protein L3J03_00550 [Desulfobacterales bacterium]|nr:hypothetical protein [Desulfobacterales bacterium]
MEIEIYLQAATPLTPEEVEPVDTRLRQWHAEGAEIRYDKVCFGAISMTDPGRRYRVDLGLAEPIRAIRELHAMLYRYGIKVFVHFVP